VYLTTDAKDIIPLNFRFPEQNGEESKEQANNIDDLLSIAGSDIFVNTRNSVHYKKFYDNSVTKFMHACEKEIAESEGNFDDAQSGYLMQVPVPKPKVKG
jgi:hypothetical protein